MTALAVPFPRIPLVAAAAVAALLLSTAGCASAPAPSPLPAGQAQAAASPVARFDPGSADLSICGRAESPLVADGRVDVADFARQLHGTWDLATRTIQGLTIDTDSHFWFDFEGGVGSDRASGTALLIDYGNLSVLDPVAATRACPAHATVSAFWRVSLEEADPQTLDLRMDGEYFGSYGEFLDGMHATEEASFHSYGDRYLAGRLVSPAGGEGKPDDVWDRISLRDGVLTYISCQGRFIDRYVKRSDRLDVEASLEAIWERRKADGSMLEPIPVIPWWQAAMSVAGE